MNVRRLLALVAVCAASVASASHPVPPELLAQQTTAGATVQPGGAITGTSIQLRGTSSSATCGATSYRLEFEVRPAGQPFTQTVTHTSTTMTKSTCVAQAYPWTTISGLTAGTYRWQVRESVGTSASTWVQFNAGQGAFTLEGIIANPSQLAFGGMLVGATSTPLTVEFINNSSASVDLNSATLTGPFALAAGPALPATVAVGDKLSFQVTATPTAPGSATGVLTFQSTAANSPHTVSLEVSGGYPKLALPQTSIAFGDVAVSTMPSTQTVTVQNTGDVPLNIASASVSSPFAVIGAAGLQIPANDSATFTVTYAPTAQGAHNAGVSIVSDDPASPHTVSLSGTGVAPRLALDKTTVAFPDVVVGSTSPEAQVTVTNPGTGTLTIGAPVLTGPFTTTLTPRTVAQGASTSLGISFAPTAPGPFSGSVVIPSDDAASPHTVSVSGTARAPVLSAAPQSHAFGAVSLGTSQTTVLTLSNTGDAPLTVSKLTFSGTHASDFTVQNAPNLPMTVAAGAQAALTVLFQPQGVGARSAKFDVQSDGYASGAVSISLTGTAQGPVATVAPSSLNFGSVNLKATSARTFNVTNSGTTALTVSGITFSTGAAADYTTSTATPFTVAPGALHTVTVLFKPNAVGTRASTAVVSSSDPVNPTHSVALTGGGIAPNVGITPLSLTYGEVRVGQSKSLNVSIQNTGTGPLTVTGLMFSGNDAPRFSTMGVGTPFTLQPGAAASTFQVVFAPTSVGAATASLAIATDDPDSPNIQVPLSGQGTAPGLTVSTPTLNFGGQLVNRTSDARSFEFTNTGSAPLQVFALSVVGAGSNAFQVLSPAAPLTLQPGQKQAVSVVVTPAATGEQGARVVIQSDASASAHVDLAALGVSEFFSVSPSIVDFGTVKANTLSDAHTVTLQNTGGDALTMSDAQFRGEGAAEFQVQFVAGPVPSSGSTTAQVTYAPRAAGTHTAELRLTSTDPKVPVAIVTLTGTSVSRVLEASPSSWDYGPVAVGTTVTQLFGITNKTSKPLNLVNFTSNSPQFVPEKTGVGLLEPGRTVNVPIAFAPADAGPAMATIGIQLEGQSGDQVELSIAISGTGVPAPAPKTGCTASGPGTGLWAFLVLLGLVAVRGRRQASAAVHLRSR